MRLCKLHCTICNKHLGCSLNVEAKLVVHKMLKVLACKSCSRFYGDGNFPCDNSDNSETYCRWCGQGGNLICCNFCQKVFCKVIFIFTFNCKKRCRQLITINIPF